MVQFTPKFYCGSSNVRVSIVTASLKKIIILQTWYLASAMKCDAAVRVTVVFQTNDEPQQLWQERENN